MMKCPDPEAIREYLSSIERSGARKSELVPAAVLVPLVVCGGEYSFLFTERTNTVEHHRGQISFPGGVADPGDADAVATALRETEEEIGVPAASVQILGILNDFGTPTGFYITPVVGLLGVMPALRISKEEVESVFTVPLSFFADPVNMIVRKKMVEGTEHDIFYFEHELHTIWGITAYIIRDFLRMIGMMKD